MRGKLRPIYLGLLLVGVLGTVAPFAFGDSYSYSTTGTFGNNNNSSETFTCGTFGATCYSTQSNTASPTLTFNSFTGNSVSGPDLDLGSISFSVPTGSFTGKESYSDDFTLAVTFTEPAGATGSFTAFLTGNVKGDVGGATFSFDPSSQVFNYAGGSFMLTLDAVSDPLQVSTTNPMATITATVSPVAAPEPGVFLLFGTGLLGLGALRRPLLNAK